MQIPAGAEIARARALKLIRGARAYAAEPPRDCGMDL